MVLLKDYDADGFVFYTNLGSQKARELAGNPKAALLFHWKSLQRQVRIQGSVTLVTDAEADAYFASRARDSRIGAWASKQSQAMSGRWELEKRVAAFALKFAVGEIPRPDFWSGYRLAPTVIEFWKSGAFRLHERIRLERQPDGRWNQAPLFP
jgi:pyridoxamine 5'-phosphate oxidase